MCGIIGALTNGIVSDILIDGLKRLEYRGYDSAGIATLKDNHIYRRRAEGKLRNLQNLLKKNPIEENLNGQNVGIGHIRWATHGAPTTMNAHPHISENSVIVHNGIIENYRTLRADLEEKGYVFESQTDSEVIAHLLTDFLKSESDPQKAIYKTLKSLDGAYALAIILREIPDRLFGARHGSPLAIGHGEGEMFLGSDAMALAPMTQKITYLEDGDWCILTHNDVLIKDMGNQTVIRPMKQINFNNMLTDKQNYRHYMLKEIYEQPTVISQTLAPFLHHCDNNINIETDLNLEAIDSISLVACGTAYYAGFVAKYYLEKYVGIPINIEIASEFRYRQPPIGKNHATLIISQSGETADSLAALRYAKSKGSKIISVVNVPESTIVRESDLWIPTHAGPEIGVASTKAFTAQIMSLLCFCLYLAKIKKKISPDQVKHYRELLSQIPRHMNDALEINKDIEEITHDLSHFSDILFMGRGVYFPLALEGALKLKEISYIHAEGYAAGELKHGPIALIDKNIPVITIAPFGELFEKTVSNMEEVSARGGKILFISDKKGMEAYKGDVWKKIEVPTVDEFIMPFIISVPLQLLAYYTAIHKGTDIDQPRNLAKSVTVE